MTGREMKEMINLRRRPRMDYHQVPLDMTGDEATIPEIPLQIMIKMKIEDNETITEVKNTLHILNPIILLTSAQILHRMLLNSQLSEKVTKHLPCLLIIRSGKEQR